MCLVEEFRIIPSKISQFDYKERLNTRIDCKKNKY